MSQPPTSTGAFLADAIPVPDTHLVPGVTDHGIAGRTGIPRSSRRLAGLAGCAAVVLGLVAGGSPAARAQGQLGPLFNPNAAASWGDNALGELGNGTTSNRDIPGTISGLTSGVLQVSGGQDHGLAITTGGTVWAWGSNAVGQLGDGTTTTRTTPVQVAGLSGVRQVSAGLEHSLALRSDGTVWAWGANDHGQLGDGTFSSVPQLTPVQVTGLTSVTKISAGGSFSLALRSDGTVWAWGRNADGELGTGSTTDGPVPVRVPFLPPANAIFASSFSTYATSTTAAGVTLWAWGGNGFGELGDGTRVSRSVPEQVTGATDIAQVAVGENFVIVLVTNGSITAWGEDDHGQLGNAPSQVPVTSPVETIAPGTGITQLSAGQYHVLAVTSAGGVIAWGRNSEGQLGNGTTAGVTGPVHVTGLSGVSQVDAGGFFSLAVYNQPQGTG